VGGVLQPLPRPPPKHRTLAENHKSGVQFLRRIPGTVAEPNAEIEYSQDRPGRQQPWITSIIQWKHIQLSRTQYNYYKIRA